MSTNSINVGGHVDTSTIRPAYEVCEDFHRVEYTNVFYEASIARMDGEIIKITFDEFAHVYTANQATEVARSIFEALSVMRETRLAGCSTFDAVAPNEYEEVFDKFVPWKCSHSDLKKAKKNSLRPLSQMDYLYVASGAFADPAPMIEINLDEGAIYDMAVGTKTGARLEMRFGIFKMEFTEEQALWLWFHLSLAANCLGQYTWRSGS
ncbi:hypothetical protein [Pseudomonas sp. 11/12A]|uniref:hypothetical protein n=1 Tax=Pseudomonas sp. 11/12A TaxID=1506582 RepID=UPI0006461EC0|nr:hypothetical protein [Pseudomonas sp. 11/12A]